MANDIVLKEDEYEIDSYKQLAPEAQKKVTEIAEKIDITDSEAVTTYGVSIQSEISEFSDGVLDRVSTNESGYVGEVLTDLMVKVKDINVNDIAGKRGSFAKMAKSFKNKFNRFMARYQKLGTQVDTIVSQLEKAKGELLSDIALLDTLHAKNLDFMKDLELYIMAGQMKLKEIRDIMLPELEAKAKETGDQADVQRYSDMTALADRFEKKLHDLMLSRMITIQTSPQLRLIQNNDQVLVEKIQSSILNTIPLWKNQIVIAISLYRQKSAIELQKQVTDTTNELLQKNSELLKENAINAAYEAERGIVDIETLKNVNANLIETIDETIRIQKEGQAKRVAAQKELKVLEDTLKAKLLSKGK
jgi:uncharacterized protein YaaN involved in tellurite resistance